MKAIRNIDISAEKLERVFFRPNPPRAIRLLDLVQPENAESLGKAVVESANGRGKIIAEAVEQMNDGISEGGHDLGRGVFSYSAGVFAQSHVAAIVQAVLDVPVFARERL